MEYSDFLLVTSFINAHGELDSLVNLILPSIRPSSKSELFLLFK
jgi:hypothetical protein